MFRIYLVSKDKRWKRLRNRGHTHYSVSKCCHIVSNVIRQNLTGGTCGWVCTRLLNLLKGGNKTLLGAALLSSPWKFGIGRGFADSTCQSGKASLAKSFQSRERLWRSSFKSPEPELWRLWNDFAREAFPDWCGLAGRVCQCTSTQ